jgi:hypothetical protein
LSLTWLDSAIDEILELVVQFIGLLSSDFENYNSFCLAQLLNKHVDRLCCTSLSFVTDIPLGWQLSTFLPGCIDLLDSNAPFSTVLAQLRLAIEDFFDGVKL